MKNTYLALLCAVLMISGCSNITVNDYANNTPVLKPQEFFTGNLTAKGVVKNRSGKVIRHFTATIKASWHNNIGTLDEKFIFNDGEIQYRTWTLTPTQTNQFNAIAGDVIGIGTGNFAGNAINLHYLLAVQYNNSTINLNVEDWMWRIDDQTVLNESTLFKFGFRVGSIQLVIQKD